MNWTYNANDAIRTAVNNRSPEGIRILQKGKTKLRKREATGLSPSLLEIVLLF